MLNIFRAQSIDQIQSAIYAINQNISSNIRQCIKSYSSHKWKKTKFSKSEYLEIFLQLKRTSYHTLLTNENRQTFPKQNILMLIPEYWLNICVWICKFVSVSVPLQITLGVLFIIVQVSSFLGYLGQFDYFVLPQECSHILCAHNLFLPAWYIDSYLYWDVKLVSSP